MTSANLGPTSGVRRSAPVATIDHAALRANAEALVAAAHGPAIADLRHDARGHGATPVARTLLAAGVDAVIVDDALRDAAPGDPRLLDDGVATVDQVALFGLPVPGGRSGGAPVMRLRGFVLSVKPLRAGEGVSYGYQFRAPHDTRVALVTGGYAQGVVRALGGAVSVLVGGGLRPIVGRVAMDVCVVDVGDLDIARGVEVVFFGDPAAGDPALGAWTAATGLRSDELTALVGARAQREHVAFRDAPGASA